MAARNIRSGKRNGDGSDDVMWRNADGLTAIWFMQDGQIFLTKSYGSTARQNVVTAGDFNHDGVSDVMWEDPQRRSSPPGSSTTADC